MAGTLANKILQRIEAWGLSPHDLASCDLMIQTPESPEKSVDKDRDTFSAETVRDFFLQEVLQKQYGIFDWDVVIAPDRSNTYVEFSKKRIYLPSGKYSVKKIRSLLAEEIEVHVFRSVSGHYSPLAIMGVGLAKYQTTEEGLANYYKQKVLSKIEGNNNQKSWISTLCIGLVIGVLTPKHTFVELCDLLEDFFYINYLRGDKTEKEDELRQRAKDEAWDRATRIFRGFSGNAKVGTCSLRDRIYLTGYLKVLNSLEEAKRDQLYTGKIKIEDLEILRELNITHPYFSQRNLALDPNLINLITPYKSAVEQSNSTVKT